MTSALAALIATVVLSSTAAAQSPQEGYLPDDQPHPQASNLQDLSLANAPAHAPVRFGMNLGVGFTVPTGGELETLSGAREFRGTADAGGSIIAVINDAVQIDLGVRGGLGGLDTSYYDGLSPRHIWLGTHVRIFPFRMGSVQPFLSALFGGDRVMAVSREGTGVYECEDGGRVVTCTEQTERTFAVGYWGRSAGLGTGLRFWNPANSYGLTVEVYGLSNTYGRRTVTDRPSRDLDDPIHTWSVGSLILLHGVFN